MKFPKDLSPEERRPPRVLVADDERLIADTLVAILRQDGFEATAVYSGIEAVEKARHWIPDLLLSDVVMPGLNGLEAAAQIQISILACKVLLFSGQAGTSDLNYGARTQSREFEVLCKPIQPAELISRLRRLSAANATASVSNVAVSERRASQQ